MTRIEELIAGLLWMPLGALVVLALMVFFLLVLDSGRPRK